MLINNAGGGAWGEPLEQFPEIGWDKIMDTNVKGPFFLIQRLLPELEKQASYERPSHIVNVGSIDGIKTPRFENFYGPSKAAIHHLTRVLAAHLIKRNIIVNGRPGPSPTLHAQHGGRRRRQRHGLVGRRRGNRGRVGTPRYRRPRHLPPALAPAVSPWNVLITCDGGSVVSKEHPA